MELHVLLEIFVKVNFIFMLRYLMTLQKGVFINVILCSFIFNGGQGKSNKILEHRENKTSFLDEIKTTSLYF